MPTGTVHDEHGMSAPFDVAADLVDVELHGLGVGKGQRESSADAARRTDCAEQVGALAGRMAARPSVANTYQHGGRRAGGEDGQDYLGGAEKRTALRDGGDAIGPMIGIGRKGNL